MFIHCPPKQLTELKTETINNKRHYVTEEGKYPSITSILGAFPNPALMEWRKRVGEEEANRVSRQATNRGTKIHSLCESYLLNEEIDKTKYMPDVLSSFYEFKSLLHNINTIHYVEAPLFSTRLKCAGRTDCIGEYKEQLSIIDFKTSKKEKREDWIEDYFIQTCLYHICYYEMTGIKSKQLVILISVEDGNNQIFIKDPKDYINKAIQKVRDYYKLYHRS